MKFILISPKNRTVYNFRGDLIKEIISEGYEVIVTGPNKDEIDKINDLGVRFELIPLDKNGLSIKEDFRYLLSLIKLFKEEKPDITLGYTIKPVIYGSLAAKIAGVKNINSMVTGVGYVFTAQTKKAKIIRFIVSILYKIGFKCANTVIFQNPDDLNEFVDRKLVHREKCWLVNGSGVNMDKFALAPLPEKLTFFMLSRVMYSKGIREYLNAAQEIKKRYPEVRFMLLGAVEDIQDSMQMNDLRTYIDNGIIDYYGETDGVASYYRQCSVYVLPSYREGTPRTVLEAMAMGRPIITTDAPGCRETVVDGVTGFIVPVQDSVTLVEKLEWFITNQEEIGKMGQASYQLCQDKFNVQKVNADMLKYLKIRI
ncbi:MAG: glycosyltransferase family 4 protein [Clostridiaceae bacterium]|nr:glycosyltransferase family 4 protein [Clostridiaceae bacterium]